MKLKKFLIYHYIIPKLTTDTPLNSIQKEIFQLLLKTDGTNNSDWRLRRLVTYCAYRALALYILVTLLGSRPIISTQFRKNTKTIIDNKKLFSLWFFENIQESWMYERWYSKDKLPIIIKLKNDFIVVDGNHRMAQQIIHNEIKYHLIKVNGSWRTLIKKIILGGFKKK